MGNTFKSPSKPKPDPEVLKKQAEEKRRAELELQREEKLRQEEELARRSGLRGRRALFGTTAGFLGQQRDDDTIIV